MGERVSRGEGDCIKTRERREGESGGGEWEMGERVSKGEGDCIKTRERRGESGGESNRERRRDYIKTYCGDEWEVF